MINKGIKKEIKIKKIHEIIKIYKESKVITYENKWFIKTIPKKKYFKNNKLTIKKMN